MKADLYRLTNETLDKLAAVTWGLDTWDRRLEEQSWDGLRSANLDGSGGGSDVSRPTEAAVIDASVGNSQRQSAAVAVDTSERRRDPTRAQRAGIESRLRKIASEVDQLHADYLRGVVPQSAPARMENPGCELCTKIPVMMVDGKGVLRKGDGFMVVTPFPAIHGHAEVEVPGRKGDKPKRIGLCYWCLGFYRRVGRLPQVEECRAHAEGRRIRVGA